MVIIKKIFFSALLCWFCGDLFAQDSTLRLKELLQQDRSGRMMEIGKVVPVNFSDFIQNYKNDWGANAADEFRVFYREKDAVGMEHLKTQQYVSNIPVEYAVVLFHLKNDLLETVNGYFLLSKKEKTFRTTTG